MHPRTQKGRQGIVARAGYPTAGKAQEADPWSAQASQLVYWTKVSGQLGTLSQNTMSVAPRRKTLWHLYTRAYTNIHVDAHEHTRCPFCHGCHPPAEKFLVPPRQWMSMKLFSVRTTHTPAYLSHVSKGLEDGKLWGLPAPTGREKGRLCWAAGQLPPFSPLWLSSSFLLLFGLRIVPTF